MGHGHGHGHGHGVPTSASGRLVGRLWAAFGIAAAVMVVEFAVGVATSSLALISDAAHMLTDVVGVGLALAAIIAAARSRAGGSRTFGLYRAEVLAALANAVLLFGVAGYVVYEAITRFSAPPEVPGLPVLYAALAGLVANVVSFLLLRGGAEESINVRGAYLEVLADLVGSVGVLVSALVTLAFGWRWADPLIGVAIGLWVLPRTFALARRSLRILFQHAPERVDVEELTTRLAALPGVSGVHDLHLWTLTSGMEVASAHLTMAEGHEQADVLESARALFADRYGIEHATLQVECPKAAKNCHELSW
ncbi:cation diffusion facilitator family transporter [Actinokineospora bangkokensis]|uniref:Cation transporter n=1 Tax=Actinokineospora bangkokensis TaxID=1193682 RepID=A0A1Q9LGW2_9PSEU|nr:cation diffusion facilitator family transporter [Actinokineospora bangkokensis]OLR91245.1 cation transporter [Actinokineospora bangkokensis]